MQFEDPLATEDGFVGTFDGLCDHYRHMIEKFGWMVIARHLHKQKKLDCYTEGLSMLLDNLQKAQEVYVDADKLRDLQQMTTHLSLIHAAAKKNFTLISRPA